jgi:predicted transcriptional regulator
VTYPNDPIVAAMRAAHQAGASIDAIARAVGMGWRTVKEILKGKA